MPYVQRIGGALVGVYANPQPQPDGSDLAPDWLEDDHPDVIAYRNPPPDMRAVASGVLRSTDYVEYRVWTPERTPSPEWLAWREAVREVVRGVANVIPVEPARYGDAAPASISDPAPQDEVPSAGDVNPPAAATVEGAYPGLFLQRDDEARLRSDVIAAISMHKRAQIEAINYGSGLNEELTAFSQYNNARAIGQEIPQSIVDLAEAYMRRTAREQAIRDHADRLELAAMNASLPMLQAMIETHQEGWP